MSLTRYSTDAAEISVRSNIAVRHDGTKNKTTTRRERRETFNADKGSGVPNSSERSGR